nr:NADH dehydrogenase subunit 5 [Ischnobaenella hainana]
MSLFFFGGLLLLMAGLLMTLFGFVFLKNDFTLFLDWEMYSYNSWSVVMTVLFDWISLIYLGCVFLISSMIMYYSGNYMIGEKYMSRFYYLLMMFVISMMMMVLSPNMIMILLGWDGLGLVSYCLVIYYNSISSYNAGLLTIMMNRVGDVAILLCIAWFFNFGSWSYIFYTIVWDYWMINIVVLIILAGFTKSAQIPFSSWLPAAMAAPTPVSSLVHSSTLVTAGVYLFIRFNNLFVNVDMYMFMIISMMTMFMSGLGANFEYDLKKIIALSTLSQLGMMISILFMGFSILSFFHMIMHAFFKALLFLCAGLIIHCMNDTQDIRYMGSVTMHLPYTCICFCISNLSLCGFVFLSGFYSKDLILEFMSYNCSNFFIFFIFFISVGLTVSYSLRLIYYCFSYSNNLYVSLSYYENFVMSMSMVVLTILSILGGWVYSWYIFDYPVLCLFPLYLKIFPLLVVLLGGYLGYCLCDFSNTGNVYSYKNYELCFYLGSMWFMSFLSTGLMSKMLKFYSKNLLFMMDWGWGESLVSKSFSNLSFVFNKKYNYYHYNNLKIHMLSFMLIFMIYFI